MKIVLAIEGGCLQQVLAENPDALDVKVIDYDAQDELATLTAVPQGDGTTRMADVWPAIVDPLPGDFKNWLSG